MKLNGSTRGQGGISAVDDDPSVVVRSMPGTEEYPKQIKQEKLIKKCCFVDTSQCLCTHTHRNSLNLCAHTILDTKQKKVLKSPIIGQKRGHYIIIYGVSDIRLLVKCNNILVKTERNIEKNGFESPLRKLISNMFKEHRIS